MLVVANGRVGIGTSNPASPLVATGTGTLNTGSMYDFAEFRNNSSGEFAVGLGFDRNAGSVIRSGGLNKPIAFWVYDQYAPADWKEKMRMNGNGNVGIGTVSPGAKLDVTGGISASGDIVSSGTFRGDGTGLTNIGGFVTLAATQTFTGQNTFSPNITTISSLTVTGNASFTTTTSTATFSGYIDIGRETVVNDCGGTTTNCTATCSSGKYIIGGGCYHGGGGAMYLQIGYPSSDYAWYCLFNNTGDVKAYAICARIK